MNYVFAGFIPVIAVCALLYFGNEDDGSPATTPDEAVSSTDTAKASIEDQKVSHTAEKQTLYDAVVEIAAMANGAIVCDADAKAKLESKSVYIHVIDMPVKDVIDNIALVGEMTSRIDGSDIIFDSQLAVVQCSNNAEGLEGDRIGIFNFEAGADNAFFYAKDFGVNTIIEFNELPEEDTYHTSLENVLVSDLLFWMARFMKMKMAIRHNMVVISGSDWMIVDDVPTSTQSVSDAINILKSQCIGCIEYCSIPFNEYLLFYATITKSNILLDPMFEGYNEEYDIPMVYLDNIYEIFYKLCLHTSTYLIYTHGALLITSDERLITESNTIFNPYRIRGCRFTPELGKYLVNRSYNIEDYSDAQIAEFLESHNGIYFYAMLNGMEMLFSVDIVIHLDTYYSINKNHTVTKTSDINEAFMEYLDAFKLECIYTNNFLYLYDPELIDIELIEEPAPKIVSETIPEQNEMKE